MTTQFFTLVMVDEELGYPPRTFASAIRNRPFPPAAHIGQRAVYSQQQVDWLRKREKVGKGLRETLPFLWRTPWDNLNQQAVYMTLGDIARALDLYETRVRQMLHKSPLEPDAVAGHYQGYLPRSVAQWLGRHHRGLLTPLVLGKINRFPQG